LTHYDQQDYIQTRTILQPQRRPSVNTPAAAAAI